jgi:hypothetical protein
VLRAPSGLRQLPADVAQQLLKSCQETILLVFIAVGSSSSSSNERGSVAAKLGLTGTSADVFQQVVAALTETTADMGGKAGQLHKAGSRIQQLAAAVSAQYPISWCCNNPGCCNLAGLSELELVSGCSSNYRCSGCRIASCCSKGCQVSCHNNIHCFGLCICHVAAAGAA